MSKPLRFFCDIIYTAFLLFLLFVLLFSNDFKPSVINGLNLFTVTILPSLFPYIIISSMISESKTLKKSFSFLSPVFNFLFNVSGNVGFAYIMGLLSGYPIGAKLIAEQKENNIISETESIKGAILCSTSSPIFTISIVGATLFNDVSFGIKLFVTHFLSSIIIGILFSFYKGRQKINDRHSTTYIIDKNYFDIFFDSITKSVSSILIVGSLITVFYLLTEILTSTGILTPVICFFNLFFRNETISKGITLSIFECTKGLSVLSSTKITTLTLPLCASICGFGGLSVILQSIMFLKNAKIKTTVFFFSKIVSVVVNFILGFIISSLF